MTVSRYFIVSTSSIRVPKRHYTFEPLAIVYFVFILRSFIIPLHYSFYS